MCWQRLRWIYHQPAVRIRLDLALCNLLTHTIFYHWVAVDNTGLVPKIQGADVIWIHKKSKRRTEKGCGNVKLEAKMSHELAKIKSIKI